MPEKKSEDSVKVFLRVRPRVQHELTNNHTCNNLSIDPRDPEWVHVKDPRTAGGKGMEGATEKKFKFHRVFSPESTQEEVYDHFAKDAVNDALEGYHGVMFVYGQTGSGKTFTMSNNNPGTEGMLQRSMRAVWNRVAEDPDYDYDLSVSYVQLYNEMLSDMLEPNQKQNAVRLSGVADRRADVRLVNEATNQGISREVNNYEETIKMFETGLARRVSSSTNMNAESSRSHTVFTLYIKKTSKVEKAEAEGISKALEGRLVICDLAGSERIKKTDAKGAQLAEATHINGSLLVLGRVVAALTDSKSAQHVPYRESKLTRLLQYSLSGWGKTRLVVNVSPSDYNTEETISAIGFGQRAIKIKQSAEKHETLDYKALYLDLQRQLDKQRDEILRDAITDHEEEKARMKADYEDKIMILEGENALLRQQVDQLKASGGGGLAGAGVSQNMQTDMGNGSPHGAGTATGTGTGTPMGSPHNNAAMVQSNASAGAPGAQAPNAVNPSQSTVMREVQGLAKQMSAGDAGSVSTTNLEIPANRSGGVFEGKDMLEIVSAMKKKMEQRDARLAEAEKVKDDLKNELNRREQQLLQVAMNFKSYKSKAEEMRLTYMRMNQELAEKLQNATGVEYLTVQAIDADERDTESPALEGHKDESLIAAAAAEAPARSPVTNPVSGETIKPEEASKTKKLTSMTAFDMIADNDEEKEKLFMVISKLQAKLNEAAAYNKQARRAIKLLHQDLEHEKTKKSSSHK